MASDNSSNPHSTTGTRFWTPGRIAISLVALGLLGAFGVSSCNSTDQSSSAPATSSNRRTSAAPVRNDPAPTAAFVSLPHQLREAEVKTLDGESLRLSDYADKVVVVNIWATWCGPCRLEMPDLVKLNNEYKSRGLVVIGLATSYNEQNDEQRVKDFIRAANINYKIVWDDGTLAAPLVQIVNGKGVIPQSFVISRDGRIMKHFQGFSAEATPTMMRQAVEQALSDKS